MIVFVSSKKANVLKKILILLLFLVFLNKLDTSATILENNELDFTSLKIKQIIGFSSFVVAKTEDSIFLFDLVSGKIDLIGFGDNVSSTFPVGLKENWIFWLSNDSSKLFVYDVVEKKLFYKDVKIEEGKRTRVSFNEIPWEIVIFDNFYFYSDETGEVFSDDDKNVKEIFREKYFLDNFLSEEDLTDLGLEVRNA